MIPIYTPPPDDGYCGSPSGGGPGGGTITAVTATAPVFSSGGFAPNISLQTSMGGSLTGSYPNPTIAPHAVGTSEIDDGAVTSAKLDSTGVIASTYGSTTAIPQIAVNAKGQITSATNVSLNVSANAVGGQLTGTVGNSTVTVGGDLIGPITAATVDGIQGRPVASTLPVSGQALIWNGSAWSPTTVDSLVPLAPDPAGTYGSATAIPVPTVDIYGRVTGITTVTPDVSDQAVGGEVGGTVGATTITVGGDLIGPLATATVDGLQGRPLAATAPASGQVLAWDGLAWSPLTVVALSPLVPDPAGTYGSATSISVPTIDQFGRVTGVSTATPSLAGDVTGTTTASTVAGLQSRPVAATLPASGQALAWDGLAWTPTTIPSLLPLVPDPASTYGSSTSIPVLTVDQYGRTTGVTTASIDVSSNAVGGEVGGTIGATTIAVGGDLVGPIATATVAGLQTTPLSATAPTTGQVLAFDGTEWQPTSQGSAAPVDAQYITLATNATLPNERVLTVVAGDLTQTDAGAGGNITLGLEASGVFAATYGSTTSIPQITIDAKGRITSSSNQSINVSGNAVGGQLTGTISNASVTVGGDLVGPITSAVVDGIQGRPVTATLPTLNQALIWNGTAWAPTDSGGNVLGPASSTINAVALYSNTTGKLIKDSAVTVDSSGNITGGTYNEVSVASHAARHSPGGPDALGTAAPLVGIGASNAEGSASTFARSDHNHTLRTGTTNITIGTVGDGQYLKLVGTALVGAAAAGAAKILLGNFVGILDAPFAANSRWYPPSSATVMRAWASLGEHASGITEFDVLRDGVSILPAPISIAAGQYRSPDVDVSPGVVVNSSEYLTISLITANGGSNAVVFVEYE